MSKLSFEIIKEAEELEKLANQDPDNYFADAWREAAKDMREKAQLVYEAERDSLVGKTYNTFTDDWE